MFEEGESVEDFALHLNGMVVMMATLSKVVEEHKVVVKILCCVPPRLKQITCAISTLLDIESLTVVNLVGQLKAVEASFEEPLSTLQQDGKLYLMEEEWDAWRIKHEVENPDVGGSGSSGEGSGYSCGRGPKKTNEYRCCGKLGHWAHDCKSKAKKEHDFTAHDKEALMVARVFLRQSPTEAELPMVTGDGGLAEAMQI
jgi:hypothetical protein